MKQQNKTTVVECKECKKPIGRKTEEGNLCRDCYPLYRNVVVADGKPIMMEECIELFKKQWDEWYGM